MLLWILMLSFWSTAFAFFSGSLAPSLRIRVLSLLALIMAGFLLFLLFTSNPFTRLLPAAVEGRDLNPLLQDPLMVIHPPMLYMGYVGFSICFAMAIAALIEGKLDGGITGVWARSTRPWALVAWAFLTTGIMLGSWWAYTELGWGGWWFWDPVENASLMPWFAGTALIHSLAVTDKRNAFKSWSVLLAIIAFSLSLLGTFLVRSGVLTSVHAFATDPKRGVFILVLLAVIIGGSLALYAWRAPSISGAGGSAAKDGKPVQASATAFGMLSRETFLLANNVLMTVALAALMLGTLYPIFLDALGLGKISVGPPYFNAVMVPILLPAALLIAAAPFVRWRGMSSADLARDLLWPAGLGLLLCVALLYLTDWVAHAGVMTWLGIFAAGFIITTLIRNYRQQTRNRSGQSLLLKLRSNPLSYYGMWAAHLGLALFLVGVTLVKSFEVEKDILMLPGQTVNLADFRITFMGLENLRGANYTGVHGVFELTQGEGKTIERMEAEKRVYTGGGQGMTEAAISYGLLRDVYLSLGEKDAHSEAWGVRMYYKPFVAWIWIGCATMALGGLLAAFDKRYRRSRAKAAVPVTPSASAVPTPSTATVLQS
jgi:cytochrome c-type biogenesis protein CcmF